MLSWPALQYHSFKAANRCRRGVDAPRRRGRLPHACCTRHTSPSDVSGARNGLADQVHEITDSIRLSDEALDCRSQCFRRVILAVRARHDHADIRSYTPGFGEDLPAGNSGKREIQEKYIYGTVVRSN